MVAHLLGHPNKNIWAYPQKQEKIKEKQNSNILIDVIK